MYDFAHALQVHLWLTPSERAGCGDFGQGLHMIIQAILGQLETTTSLSTDRGAAVLRH